MPQLKFDITGDNKQLLAALQQVQQQAGASISKVEQSGAGIEQMFSRLAKAAGGAFATYKIQEFAKACIETRKEFQSLEVSFSTLLGSSEKGKKMFQEITKFATSTPMLEKDLAKGAQTLLGFGIAEEKVLPYLKQLGDVSMGDSEKFNSLTLAFAQIQASGKLMGQDLLQLINAGFNPLQTISEKTGKSIGQLKDEMSEGKISAQMVADAFKDATSEGGKFNGMLEAQSKTMAGASSNLEGAFQKFENALGEKIEPLMVEIYNKGYDTFNDLSKTIEGIDVSKAASSFEEFLNVVEGLAVAYGTYKAITLTVVAIDNVRAASLEAVQNAAMTQLQGVIAMKEAEIGANGEVVVSEQAVLSGREKEIAAAQEEAAAVVKGLQAKAQEAEVNLQNAINEQAYAESRVDAAKQSIAMRELEYEAALKSGDGAKIEAAENALNTAELEKNDAVRALGTAERKTEAAQIEATNTAKIAETATTSADTAAQTADAASTGLLTKMKIALSAAIDKVTAAMARNPYTVVAVAVAALAFAIYELWKNFADEQQRLKGLTGDLDKYGRSTEEVKRQTDALNDTYKDTNSELVEMTARLKNFNGGKDDEKALVKECNNKYGEAMGYYSSVADWYKVLTAHSRDYCTQMINEARIRQLANQIAENEQKKHDIMYNEDGTTKLYSTERHYKTTSGYMAGGIWHYNRELQHDSDQDIANRDISNLNKANAVAKEEMNKLMQDNIKLTSQLHTAPSGTTQTGKPNETTPLSDKEKKKLQKQQEAQNKALATQQQKYNDLLLKQEEDADKKRIQLAQDTEQAIIDQKHDGYEKSLAQIKLNYQKQLSAIQESEDEMLKEQTEAARKRWELSNPNASKSGQNWENTGYWEWQKKTGGAKLSDDQQKLLTEQKNAAYATMQSETGKLSQDREQKKADYLKQYGSIEQQRLAITEETERKIQELRASGASEYEIAGVQESAKEQLDKLNADDIFKKIDWENVFSDLGGHTKDYLLGLRQQLQELLDSGKLTDVADIEKVQAKINDINGEVANKGGVFSFQGTRAQEQQRREDDLSNARNNLIDAQSKENAAEINLDYAKSKGDADAIAIAESKLAKAREKTAEATDKAQKAEDAAKRTSAQAIADWFSDAQEFVTKKGLDQLPQLFSELGLGDVGESIGKGLSGFDNAAGAATDFASGNYIGALTKGIAAFEDFGSLFGLGGSNHEEEVAYRQEIQDKLDTLDKTLNYIREDLQDSNSTNASKTLADAEQAYQTKINGLLQQFQSIMSDDYGGSHSEAYHWNKNSGGLMQQIAQQYGLTATSWQELLSQLTPDIAKDIIRNHNDWYQTMSTQGYNDGDFKKVFDELADMADELEEYKNEYVNALTGMTFDGMRDNFKSQLLDMDSDMDDFIDDINQKFYEAALDDWLSTSGIEDELKAWQTKWAQAQESGGELTEEEADQMRDEYEAIVGKAKEQADKLAEMYGADDSSSSEANGSINAAKSMTEDTANELVGRMTAIQLSVESGNATRSVMAQQVITGIAQLTGIATASAHTNELLDSILVQHAQSNSYLEDMVKYNKAMYEEWSSQITTMRQKIETL